MPPSWCECNGTADGVRLADDILRDPVVVMVGAQKPVSGIVHSVYPVAQARKGPLLTTLLRREAMHSVLVFVKRSRGSRGKGS